ncbi:CPBP family intramembrane glutamic endopeptidase [Aneurinibacillus uraniidurans]|uniref:CPBP family intramembrane glutamic endopeptidase n=1 Tax=Aneurinibacillus uraniidurans TaxID=2966586 RepID=UPI00234A0AD6|nr:CPBP family intramembrane glutamic endopeptidase [Aneurinibacillus sp. B1]WCN39623.1 CPBP family intramembrane metalloprotease [Aneurinibacillus sp. B1]
MLFIMLLAFLLVYDPIFGKMMFERFVRKLIRNQTTRVSYYYETIAVLWGAVLLLFLAVWQYKVPLTELGLQKVPTFNLLDGNPLNAWISAIVLGLILLYGIVFVVNTLLFVWKPHYFEKIQKEIEEEGYTTYLLPTSTKEKCVWVFVSITAGVCEELLYRSFLMYYLPSLLDTQSVWISLILSSLIFGLAHTYQGVKGAMKATTLGMYFCLLYLVTDSIIPGMILHTLIDLAGVFMMKSRKEKS